MNANEFSWDKIPSESECLSFLEAIRWNGIITSPFIPNSKVYYCKDNKFKCRDSGKYFNARTNTIFHNSKIPLRTWFAALWILEHRENPITSVELAKIIGTTQKTAWFLLRRLKRYEIDGYAKNESLNAGEKIIQDTDKLKITDWLNLLRK